MIDVAGRRAFVRFARARKMSASGACTLVKVSRRFLFVGPRLCLAFLSDLTSP